MAATKPLPRTFPTSIDPPAETRQAMIDLCHRQPADSFGLYGQTKQAHWNVKGKDFYRLHLLFDTLAAEVLDHVDLIAERATALGGDAAHSASTRKAIDTATETEDRSTADMFTEISREPDTSLWFLEEHLRT
jgi:starvation-inducible DNA-binding protein